MGVLFFTGVLLGWLLMPQPKWAALAAKKLWAKVWQYLN